MRQDRTSDVINRIHEDRCSTTRIAISIFISRETFLQSRLIKNSALRNQSTNKRILRILYIKISNYTFFNVIQVRTECAKRPKSCIFINVLLNVVSCVTFITMYVYDFVLHYSFIFTHISISSCKNYPEVE